MSDYAIGDIQGCFDSLQALLAQIRFDRRRDRLWLVGDLVNRGPRSLDVLRWARDLDDRAVVVLGNHDLHLLARAAGVAEARRRDTIEDVLAAPDRDELLGWVRSRPLFHHDGPWALVHAGLIPSWSIERAVALAGEVHTALAGSGWAKVLAAVRAGPPPTWRHDLTGSARISAIVSVLCRIRACKRDGTLCSDFAGHPDQTPAGFAPWYAHRPRASVDTRILFGHWAARGFWVSDVDNVVALDSGCVWGSQLTAFRLDDGAVFQQRAID